MYFFFSLHIISVLFCAFVQLINILYKTGMYFVVTGPVKLLFQQLLGLVRTGTIQFRETTIAVPFMAENKGNYSVR